MENRPFVWFENFLIDFLARQGINDVCSKAELLFLGYTTVPSRDWKFEWFSNFIPALEDTHISQFYASLSLPFSLQVIWKSRRFVFAISMMVLWVYKSSTSNSGVLEGYRFRVFVLCYLLRWLTSNVLKWFSEVFFNIWRNISIVKIARRVFHMSS